MSTLVMPLPALRLPPLAMQWLPALATVLLHALLLFVLLSRWEGAREPKVIEARKLTPQIINARLVTEAELKAQQRKPQQQAPASTRPQRSEPPARTAPRQAAPAQPKAASAAPRNELAQPTKPAAKPAAKPEASTPKVDTAALAAAARRELAGALAAEQAAEVALSAEEMVASYAALIQRTVVGYWSRPPSARNGMQALLAVQLIPTGEVVGVSVIESSGSAAFDRSAINAVEKAGRFPELQNLPPREFENTFRRFRLLFRPEDLRY